MLQLALSNSTPDAPRGRFAGGNVRGTMLRAHLDWVRHHSARDEVIEFFETLGNDLRRKTLNVLAAAWYPFDVLVAVDTVIMNSFGDGRLPFLQELGRYSANVSLNTVYRFFQRDTVHDFFRHSALLHGHFQDFGSSEYVPTGDGHGVLVLRDATSYSPIYCASAAGFYRECIRLHGGTRISIAETLCHCHGDGECRYELAWV